MTALRMLEVFTLSTKKKGRIDESNGRVTRRIQKLRPRGPTPQNELQKKPPTTAYGKILR